MVPGRRQAVVLGGSSGDSPFTRQGIEKTFLNNADGQFGVLALCLVSMIYILVPDLIVIRYPFPGQ
jgi:hypothetical protein